MTARRKPEHKRKKENVNISMTTSQKTEIEERAEAKKNTVSGYIRDILFSEQV